ncbi:hypothetical protein BP6252_12800 [Coleophoma cylindrospora]|uniref:Uncharacterized protein n=1 Tax=Coleophoma cylindrospora TaxID=1849047 RepID=A0A3D8QCY8_9HELO|nr:hypothetical protein BP6252_12800 [Coleophoma cylindrospora]
MHTLQDLFEVTPILDTVCLHLELPDIFALKRTSRPFTWILDSFYKRRWSVNRYLRRFVTDPTALRSQLAKDNAVIAGGFALQFFANAVWKDSDLDIYVEYSLEQTSKAEIGGYLREYEGYKLEGSIVYPTHRKVLTTYARTNPSTGFSSKINLIHTIDPPVLHILTNFCTTATVNFITWNKAYCIFPDSTFLHKTSYQLNQEVNDSNGPYLAKLRRRGWMTLQTQWKDYERSTSSVSNSRRLPRRIGDAMTWKLTLDTAGVAPPQIPDYVLEQTHFSIRRREDRTLPGNNGSHYEIHAKRFVSYVLRHTYIAESLKGKDFWCDFLGPRLDELTRLEFLGVEPALRPEWLRLGNGAGGAEAMTRQYRYLDTDGFERGDLWTYWDHMVPKWHEIWCREGEKRGPA